MSQAPKPASAIRTDDLAELIEDQEREAAARRRAAGLADAEARKRRQLQAELVEALRSPLIPGSAPSDLEAIAAQRPHARPVRHRGGEAMKRAGPSRDFDKCGSRSPGICLAKKFS